MAIVRTDPAAKSRARQFARMSLYVVLIAFALNGIIDIQTSYAADQTNGWTYACMGAVYTLELYYITDHAVRRPLWLKILMLAVQAVFTFIPLLAFHEIYGAMGGFVCSSCLLLLPGWPGWAMFVLGIAGLTTVEDVTGPQGGASWQVYYVVSTLITGLLISTLVQVARLVEALHQARGDLARMAVAKERLRFARDLHDLLGYSLSSITLKSELTYRLAGSQPELAKRELASILEVSRQALADVRVVASSYRELHLADEAASVRSVLEAAQVDLDLEVDVPELPAALDTVLATTLREGVTNVLRHSKVQHCTVRCRVVGEVVRLELVNDGVEESDGADGSPDHAGSGLESLTQRLKAVGGTLTAGVGADGRFHLVAEAPLSGPVLPPADLWEELPAPRAAA